MIAHLNGGKALRDALYLSNYHVSRLAWMMILTALLPVLVALAPSSGVLAWSGDLAVRLLVLGGLDLICAVATFTLGGSRGDERALPEGPAVDASPSSMPSGRGMFRSAPYLGYLAIAMALFAASAALLEYCFKAQVQSSFPAQADLQKVFAKFYTSTALASLLVQLVLSRWALRRIGLVPTAAALPAGVVLTGAGAL